MLVSWYIIVYTFEQTVHVLRALVSIQGSVMVKSVKG